MYAEATSRHPSRWPGTGATSGIGAVRATISHLTGRPIDAVLVSDLWGVIKVVDAMGGIDITVPAPVYDRRYADPVLGSIVLDIKAGAQHFDGRMALAYARSRHQDSDYGRMARQQTLLLALRDQLNPVSILGAPALVDAARGFVWTDIARESLPALVEVFSRAQGASVKQLRIRPTAPRRLPGGDAHTDPVTDPIAHADTLAYADTIAGRRGRRHGPRRDRQLPDGPEPRPERQ
jgi:LCP family protein required for cell wall assembly